MASITVDIVAPDQTLWSGTARSVTAPTVEGSIGLLPHHEPVLSVLAVGVVAVVSDDGSRTELPITGGFLSFDHDTVTIVADPGSGVAAS
ncbi:F0F1 ATP synthase subunit epsilon [Demequina capsici]|uniref:ATP synthase epsilon chain n=1 Tax=Demequina capsici TaxID=3075620 RepID=A0AA96FBF8_9MICO|nr:MULTISPECIES: F0F1 ATP synthase subunit epsilon [unclassified Demequina]WNM23794.1 F0F1 ATP synthase subunit epsilon [Demequina sp. OYTSA14]WNM26633.1 F0F1 ATP synthase subunit epsilon [Demequina sp. PMTSA13]